MAYQPYYPGGWQPGPGGGTPISHEALNHMEDGLVTASELAEAAIPASERGQPNGVATLDNDGKLTPAQRWTTGNALFATGVYAGNSTDGRSIPLGFAAQFIKIMTESGAAVDSEWSVSPVRSILHPGGSSGSFHSALTRPVISGPNLVLGGTAAEANLNGVTYRWFAWGVAE